LPPAQAAESSFPPSPAATLDSTLAEAVRFRQTFGLDAREAVVEELARSTAPSEVFGVPLTIAEEAVMQRRGEIQSQLGALRTYANRHRDVWGGTWLSYPAGGDMQHALMVNVAVTDGEDAHRTKVAPLVPEGADLEVHRVQWTQDFLDSLHREIAEGSAFFDSLGTIWHAADTRVADNVVEIVLSHVTPAIDEAVRSRFGPMVRVREGGPVVADACTRSNCGPPWRAGLRMTREGPGNGCTSGFLVRHYAGVWNYAIWTAGHCGNGTWHMGLEAGPTIGATASNYFVNGSDADVQVITLPSASSADDDYLEGTPGCNPCTQRDLAYRQSRDGDETGGQVRNNGYVSGTTVPGVIQSTNVTFPYMGVTLYRQRRATYSRMNGDSGGPVVALNGPSTWNMAAGSHTHFQDVGDVRYAIYTHVFEMEEKTGWSVFLSGD
jgi:hypothetical protein